jgi:hypothetical protein
MEVKKSTGEISFDPYETQPAPDLFPEPPVIPIDAARVYSCRLLDRIDILRSIVEDRQKLPNTKSNQLTININSGKILQLEVTQAHLSRLALSL